MTTSFRHILEDEDYSVVLSQGAILIINWE